MPNSANFVVPAIILGALLLFCELAVADPNKSENQLSVEYNSSELAALYVDLAFGSEFSLLFPEFESGKLMKRDQTKPVTVITLPQASVQIDEAISVARDVVEDIYSHTNSLSIDFYESNQIVNIGNSNENQDKFDIENSISIFIGSMDELSSIGDSVALSSPDFDQIFQLSISAATRNARPFCMFVFWRSSEGPEFIGRTIILLENTSKLRQCLYEEIMQSFGITNDFPAGTPSIFNDDNVFDLPTDLDWRLWQIHTDPRLLAGMSVDAVRAVLTNH